MYIYTCVWTWYMKKWEIELREKTLARFYGYGYNFIQEVGIYIVHSLWMASTLFKERNEKICFSTQKRAEIFCLYLPYYSAFLAAKRRDVEGVGR